MSDRELRSFVAPGAPEPVGLAAAGAARRVGPGVLRLPVEDLARLPPEELEALLVAEVAPTASAPRLVSGQPLPRILAEGDSWFAYPRSWILVGPSSNIILQLHRLGGYDITSLAANGDEAVEMLAGSDREQLVDALASAHYDALLFSGGGNDIVGQYNIDYLVEVPASGQDPQARIHEERFARRLGQIERAYRDLLALIGRFARNKAMPVVAHTYDNAVPTGKGAKFVGGLVSVKAWIKPYLDPMGVPPLQQQQILIEMLDRFEEMLGRLEVEFNGRLHVVRTRGTIGAAEWKDEIHPTPNGFKNLARKVKSTLDAVV